MHVFVLNITMCVQSFVCIKLLPIHLFFFINNLPIYSFLNRFSRAVELYLQGIVVVSKPVLHFDASAQKLFLFCAGKIKCKYKSCHSSIDLLGLCFL